MRVLLTSFFEYPHVGGLSTYMTQLEQELRRLGHHVETFAPHPDGNRFYVKDTELQVTKDGLFEMAAQHVHRVYQGQSKHIPSWMIHQEIERYAFEIAAERIVDFTRYDIVHAQDVLSARTLARLKPRRMPLVATLHGCFMWDRLRALGYTSPHGLGETPMSGNVDVSYLKLVERYGAMAAERTIVPSEWLKNLLVSEFGVPPHQLTVIPYGHDVRGFLGKMKERTSVPFPRDKRVIFCHARLDKVKGHQYLLDALAQLKHRSDWCCYIAGDGEQRGELLKQTETLGLNNRVTFLGARHDIPSLLRHVDIEVLASVSENLPNVVCEAQIAGTVIIASAVGGIPEMIQHEETGLLFPPLDSLALAQSIERLLDNPRLIARISARAQQWGVGHWDIQRVVRETLDVYQVATDDRKFGIPDELYLHTVISHSV